MSGLISFWSHALAACLFASLLMWRLRERLEGPTRLLVAAFFATAVWASISAIRGPTDAVTVPAETFRNLAWIMLLHGISGGLKSSARRAIRLVFGAVALAIGIQITLDLLALWLALPPALAADVVTTTRLLRITTAAGALILVHNVYGQAAPESRTGIRTAMLGLALMWGYDLNLYTLAYLDPAGAPTLFQYRGLFLTVVAPLFIIGAARGTSLRLRLSRAATFQSLSLLGICAYFVVMAVLATALRDSEFNWASAITAVLLAGMMIVTAVLVLSEWVRGWVKVKLSKHLFEHRYDYRSEWLRFTETLGRAGPAAPPLGERIIRAFAAIVDAPGGMLLVGSGDGAIVRAADWNWPAGLGAVAEIDECGEFWAAVENSKRIIEFEALRQGWAHARDAAMPLPIWMFEDETVWAGIPLVHQGRLIGIVLLAAPDYRRSLDWEDFDLLRTAGGQAASSLAESQLQEALSQAQRFEEFNRRFAFILHDVKNLVSQLSLLTRNAERHADNPEFRADMIATLKSSVGKMNDLLARLSPHASARIQRSEAQPIRPIVADVIAAKRRDRVVTLLAEDGLWVQADAVALEQAIGHLLQNAVDASPPNSPIEIRIAAAGAYVSVSIRDSGCGMDGEFVRNRLFQPFVSTKDGGFGIGAFEARSLITAMGGRIAVDSRAGSGTTFTILLPAASDGAAGQTQPDRKRA